MKLEIGKRIAALKGHGEGVKFSISDSGAELLVCFNRPNQKEIKAIKDGNLQFGMFVRDGVMFILSKFGSMPWMDAPFHVALTKNLTELQEIEKGQGYGCIIILADTLTGEIKALRYISFNTEFSRKLKKNIQDQMIERDNFNIEEYDSKLRTIMKNYSTKTMVKYSEANCRVK